MIRKTVTMFIKSINSKLQKKSYLVMVYIRLTIMTLELICRIIPKSEIIFCQILDVAEFSTKVTSSLH